MTVLPPAEAGPAAAGEPLSFHAASLEIRRLFPTPVVSAALIEPEALNRQLADAILAHAGTHPSVLKTNDGGWQSTDDFQVWGGEPAARLLQAASGLVASVTGIDGPDGLQRGAPEWRVNAWANINRPGDANHPHTHPGGFWSGVYWVEDGRSDGDDPASGVFEMADPRGVLPTFYAPQLRYAISGCLSAGQSEFIHPASGTMTIFPSWLVHSVRRYTGRGQRISIAFNFFL